MCNERHGLLLVVAVTWGAATAGLCAEDADRFRVFTDRDDHRAEARLTNFNQQTGVVTLRSREGKSGQFPLLSFSAHDQDYIRARFVPRSWTSVDGRTTSPLAYGGIEGSVVMLVPKTGKTLRTEFSNLSPIDQAFLRRIDPDAAPALPEADGDMGTDPPPKTGTASEEPSRPNPNLVQKYAEQRTWTIDGNRSLDARFVARQNGTVVLELPDGPKRSISASSLSAADADYIQDFEAKIRALTQHHPCQSAAIRVSARDGQQSPARQVHLSSDGTRLAVTYGDYEVRGLRYFDAAKGTVLGAHELPERVRHLDGGRQAFTFVGSGDAIALATVEEIRGPQSLEVYGVAVMSLNGIVQRSSPRIGTTARHNRSALKLSPEGRQLAFAYHVSNSDRTTSVEVAILDTASLERLQALTAPVSGSSGTGTGPSLTFSPDGRRLAMLYFGEHLAVWDLTTAREVPVFERAKDTQAAVEFDSTGSRLIVFGLRSSAKIIDLGSAEETRDLSLPDRQWKAIAFSPTEPLFATSSDGADPDCVVVLRDVRYHQEVQRLTGHQATVVHLSFAGNGRYLASLDLEGMARVWDLTTGIAEAEAKPPLAAVPFNAQKAREHQQVWANYLSQPMELSNSIGMRLVLIPAGEFLMGSPESDKEWESGEKPQHGVRITRPFYLGVHEVTQQQYERVMTTNPSNFKGPQLPVEMVNWKDAVKFCEALSSLPEEMAAGRTYRLPTEAEWEFACRAGTTTRHCFGDDASRLGDHAWFGENSHQTSPVGRKKPNAFGLYDIHGNVFEWCQDGYTDYQSSPVDDPQGPDSASLHVSRGGGWRSGVRDCRSAARRGFGPTLRLRELGFRVAAVPTSE